MKLNIVREVSGCYVPSRLRTPSTEATIPTLYPSGNVTFVYDGNGNRVKKTGGGVTTVYVNRYYEKVVSGNVTSSYYLGNKLIAQREGTVLRYIHQDHLTGTAVMSSDNGNPTMRTDTPFIYISPRTSALDVHMNLPEEFRHVVQEIQNPFFRARYVWSYVNRGGPLFGESGYRNNVYEIEAKAFARRINDWRRNPSSPLW